MAIGYLANSQKPKAKSLLSLYAPMTIIIPLFVNTLAWRLQVSELKNNEKQVVSITSNRVQDIEGVTVHRKGNVNCRILQINMPESPYER